MAENVISSSTGKNSLDITDDGDDKTNASKKLKVNDCSDNVQSATTSSSITSSTLNNGSRSINTENCYVINPALCDHIDTIKQLYNNESDVGVDVDSVIKENVFIHHQPFRVVQVKNFIHKDEWMHKMLKSMPNLASKLKNNDLYSMKHSNDLTGFKKFSDLCTFFQNDVRTFIQNVTGIALNSKLSISISKYEKNDYLLCHDDQLESRKIAFILYFVDEQWTESDGGLLELFECKEGKNQPSKVVKRIIPEWNMFNFFEVQPISYHQVSEVKTSQLVRLSINGWFYTDTTVAVPQYLPLPFLTKIRKAKLISDSNISYELFLSWVNPTYICDDIQQQIQDVFVEKSEIQLNNFFRNDKYQQLLQALNCVETQQMWKRYYRPMLCNYEYIPEKLLLRSGSGGCEQGEQNSSGSGGDSGKMQKVPQIIQEAFQLFYSEAFFLVLSNLTGIRLHELAHISDDDDDEEEIDYGNSVDQKVQEKNPIKNSVNYNIQDDDDDVQFLPTSTSDANASLANKATSSNQNKDISKAKSKEGTKITNSTCRGEMRRWKNGCYSLSNVINPENRERQAIDVMYFLNVPSLLASERNENSDFNEADGGDENDEQTLNNNHECESQQQPSQSSVVTGCSVEVDNVSSTSTSVLPRKTIVNEVIEISDDDDEDDDDSDEDSDDDSDDSDVQDAKKDDTNHDDIGDEPEIINLDDEEDDDDEEEDDEMDENLIQRNEIDEQVKASGGYVTYIADSIPNDLLTVLPTNNCLNIVYRLRGTQRFMKYINEQNQTVPFNEFSFVYYS